MTMSDETKEKRKHEEHHPHHTHKHEHHGHDDEGGIHPGWFFVIGAILLAIIVIGWTMNL